MTRETYAAAGVKSVRWAGGALDGRTVAISEPFIAEEGRKVFHPPIDERCTGEIFPN